MSITETINDLIGIKESFELPNKLLEIMLDDTKRATLIKKYKSSELNGLKDPLRDYFQQLNSDRKNLKQDYTPDSICALVKAIAPPSEKMLDMCAGVGSLSIHMEGKELQLEELSQANIPVLLFNLCINGTSATVIQKDVLSKEVKKIYKVDGEDVKELDAPEEIEPDLIISNPPYSLAWEPSFDERFWGYDLPPKSKADYAFILDALYRTTGKAIFILPHGVLFRGASEGAIRESLIEKNVIDAVIGLPGDMFLNTSIPTVIFILDKNKKEDSIFFCDASKLGKKTGKYNVLENDVIEKIKDAYKKRADIEKFSRVVRKREIIQNDYNLNIPRYIDTSEEKEKIDIGEIVSELEKINDEIQKTSKSLCGMLQELHGDIEYEKAKDRLIKVLEG